MELVFIFFLTISAQPLKFSFLVARQYFAACLSSHIDAVDASNRLLSVTCFENWHIKPTRAKGRKA